MSSRYDTVRPGAEVAQAVAGLAGAGRRSALRRDAGGVATGSVGAAGAAGEGEGAVEAGAGAGAEAVAGGSGAAFPQEDLPLDQRSRPVPARLLQPRAAVRRVGGGIAAGSVGATRAAGAAGAGSGSGAGGSGTALSQEDVPLAQRHRLSTPRGALAVGAVGAVGAGVGAGVGGAAGVGAGAGTTAAAGTAVGVGVGAGAARTGAESSLEDVPHTFRFRPSPDIDADFVLGTSSEDEEVHPHGLEPLPSPPPPARRQPAPRQPAPRQSALAAGRCRLTL